MIDNKLYTILDAISCNLIIGLLVVLKFGRAVGLQKNKGCTEDKTVDQCQLSLWMS